MKMREIWIEEPLGDLEEEYRRHFLESDISLSSLAIIIWLFANTAFVYSDYVLLGLGWQFWVLILSKAAINVWGIFLVLFFRNVNQPNTYDWLLFSFLLGGALVFLYSNSTRPIWFGGPAITNTLAILSVYLVFQTGVTFRMITNFILSLGVILILFLRSGPEFAPWMNILIISVVLSNALGIPVAVRLSNLRRAEFLRSWELRVSREELRREILKRTRSEDDLKSAKEAAEAATRAKGEFLANMSHEIRTPLNAVLGMIDLMLDSDMTNRQRERAKIIKSAADSLLALLNDVLDLSKIEAGKLDLAETDFSVRSILASTESLLAVRANDKMVRVSYTVGDEVPSRLRGDPNRLRQILLNLGNNAVKFTEQGEVSIRADLREQLNGEVVLHFVVSDTGIGIPPDKLESIFGRFSQADTSTTKKYGGTGLGLAISSQLATAMGGNMWVESELGKGSTFHFTAPFRRVGEPQEFDPTSTQHIMATTDLRGTKVLLVEDNIFNQAVALETLKRWGCDVTVASNGREAVEAFDSKQFDVILMDLQMPEMDGFEATRIIRSKETAGRIPIIAQTAHAFAEYRDRCLEAGMDEHISKPITVSELLKVLARFASANRRAVTPVDIPSDKSGLNGPWNTDSRTFDYEALLERLGGDREALKEMMNLFSSHIPALVQDVRSAVIAEDWGRLAKLSHKLAGACATFGANALADVAREMERSAKNSQAMRIEALLSRMDLELRSLEKCVGRFEF